MTRITTNLIQQGAISASWARCEQQHQMVRTTARPGQMRLQSSEIAPRREALLERTAGSRRLFRHLAINSAGAGHCTVVTDTSGILVMLDNGDGSTKPDDWNGIGLGTCWDERIAGTNGVAMALLEEQHTTVRGVDHYLTRLAHFTCSAAPLLDADNQMIGVLSLAAIDHGNTVDYLFARQMLDATASQVQRNLFEQKYQNAEIYCITPTEQKYLLGSNELVAVDEAGIILGSTTKAHALLGLNRHADLTGKSFELLTGQAIETLRVPERVVSLGNTTSVSLSPREQKIQAKRTSHKPASSKAEDNSRETPERPPVAPDLTELAAGSKTMETICNRAEAFFHRGIPFVIEGASGTGKSAMINALVNAVDQGTHSLVNIDCATLSESEDDRHYFKTLLEQARVMNSWSNLQHKASTLLFDNVDELPLFAQAGLRSLLNDIESRQSVKETKTTLRIIATCRHPLHSLVNNSQFRDDLYYLLASAVIRVPCLPQRENISTLLQRLANRIAGRDVEITPEALDVLSTYHWPGNIRQLRSVLRQALLEGSSQRISLNDLTSTSVCEMLPDISADVNTPNEPTVKVVYDERTQIVDALHGARWNISQAARRLGMARSTIHRKMKHYGIVRPQNGGI